VCEEIFISNQSPLDKGRLLSPAVLSGAFSAVAMREGRGKQSQVSAASTDKPIIATLGNHHFKILAFDAVWATDVLASTIFRPFDQAELLPSGH
jgi:hypothetical protein